ncbi:MAG: hypothetical protein EHM41_16825 [Chloroflexi bacterium]|nr:MAG: hypothetical protein EHM41_16825 [Chloroflexota bacterium]
MTDTLITPLERPRRIRFDWIPGVLFTPRKTFAAIGNQNTSVWFVPIAVLIVAALLFVVVAGPLKREALMMQGPELPPDFEYYSPEQQAQFLQAAQATQGPAFIYGFPALLAVGKVLLGWMLVGGLLHLLLTMLGGRGNTGITMNIVAWAGLPFALRYIVQVISMLITKSQIAGTGISGFAPAGEGFIVFIGKLMEQIDIYLIWHILLLFIAVRGSNGISKGKAWTAVLVTVLVTISLAALAGYLSTLFGGLEVARPFFF